MMNASFTLTFFINPFAGKGAWSKAKKQIDHYCLQHNYEPEYFFTGDPEKINEIIQEKENKGVPVVFVVGGDGTVNELARHMVGREIALGILPMGSGNGLARHLHIPIRLTRALEMIRHHTIIEMDYGVINDTVFFTTAGIGFDAEVSNVFSAAPHRGLTGYMYSFLKVIPGYAPREFTIKTENASLTSKAFLLTFANASQYGNAAYIAPQASVTDHHLDIVIVQSFPLLHIPILGLRLFTRTLPGSRYVTTLRCVEATVTLPRQGHIHFDGENGKHNGNIHVQIGKKKLKVLIPERSFRDSEDHNPRK